MNRKYPAQWLAVILAVSLGTSAALTFFPIWAVIYLMVGIVWSFFLYLGLGPLRNGKENLTFWAINIFLWPLVLGLMIFLGITMK